MEPDRAPGPSQNLRNALLQEWEYREGDLGKLSNLFFLSSGYNVSFLKVREGFASISPPSQPFAYVTPGLGIEFVIFSSGIVMAFNHSLVFIRTALTDFDPVSVFNETHLAVLHILPKELWGFRVDRDNYLWTDFFHHV